MKDAKCREPLGLSEIKIFISLVDAGSPSRGFQKKLGLTHEDVKYHTGMLDFYRKYVEAHDKIVEIRRSDLSPEEKQQQINAIRQELKDA